MQRHMLSDLFGLKKRCAVVVVRCTGAITTRRSGGYATYPAQRCGKVKREASGWLSRNSFCTKRFAFFVGRRCRPMTIQDVAKELKLDWHTVKELNKQYMEKLLQRAGVPAPEAIGIDEISFRKGHTYHNCDKRFGEETTDKVRRQVQVGRRYGYVL
ncbi:MAG: transposase family protein [Planctomycetia bacterium]|nr:transposase family protein [Candidatus Brocadia sp.]QOJ05199.1 MAG: transposase family protein [Planctomycetia bacterium]TVL97926.1 MAG: hypothetical protein CV082_02370 [Candidatus Brocadia sp. BL1]HQU31153.1 helix-turn-helix domain-containing protein [Candidatus Brocadia sapporoensis]